MKVDAFIPCFIDQFYPETAFNMIAVLEKAGCEVHYNPKQTCCGQIAFNNGYWDEAKEVGKKFIKDFSNDRIIVGPSASCVGMVRNNYKKLFHNTSMHLDYKQLAENIFEVCGFLVNVIKVTDFEVNFPHKVTFHDSCASLREYGLKNEARILLSKIKGLELIEMQKKEECCGFGGSFSVKHPSISTAMAQQKIENAMETDAEFIISTDSSCLMHLEAYIKKHELSMKVMHIIDLLAYKKIN